MQHALGAQGWTIGATVFGPAHYQERFALVHRILNGAKGFVDKEQQKVRQAFLWRVEMLVNPLEIAREFRLLIAVFVGRDKPVDAAQTAKSVGGAGGAQQRSALCQ